MEENRLPQSIIGAVISWILTAMVFLVAHIGAICGVFAILASLYSIKASRETTKLRKKQQKQLDEETEL
jgi:uncharacterized membrane protein